MLAFVIILIGYILLPISFYMIDASFSPLLTNSVSAILLGLSIAGTLLAWKKKSYFILSLPLLAFGLFNLATLIAIKIL